MINKKLKEKFMKIQDAEELENLLFDYFIEYLYERESWDEEMISHYIKIFKISRKNFEEYDMFCDDNHGDPPIDINSMIGK